MIVLRSLNHFNMDYYDNGNKSPSPRTYWTDGVLIPAQWAIISPDSKVSTTVVLILSYGMLLT